MSIFGKSLIELTTEDIHQLVTKAVAEDSTIEFKRDLEIDAQGKIREAARNKIAREVVAFANSDGGTVVIGIDESEEQPHRASAICPIPDCDDFADRLRRAIYEIVEPKMPTLAVRGVRTKGAEGVIVFSVPKSMSAPHRVESLKECFRRVADESRPMSMREIQEMTISTSYESQRLDDRLKRLAEENENHLRSWDGPVILPLAAICISAASTTPLSIEKIVGNPAITQVLPTIEITIDKQKRLDFPWGRNQRRARPIVRGERRTHEFENYALFEQLFRNGDANFTHMRKYTRSDDHHAYRFYIGWIFNLLAVALLSIDKLRVAAGMAEAEYALDIIISVRGEILLGFTDNDEWHDL